MYTYKICTYDTATHVLSVYSMCIFKHIHRRSMRKFQYIYIHTVQYIYLYIYIYDIYIYTVNGI